MLRFHDQVKNAYVRKKRIHKESVLSICILTTFSYSHTLGKKVRFIYNLRSLFLQNLILMVKELISLID